MSITRSVTAKRQRIEIEKLPEDFTVKNAIKWFEHFDQYCSKLPRPDNFLLLVLPIFLNATEKLEDWNELFDLMIRVIISDWISIDLAQAIYLIFKKLTACKIEIDEEIRDYVCYMMVRGYISQAQNPNYLNLLMKPFWQKNYKLDNSELAITKKNKKYMHANSSTLFNMNHTRMIDAHHSHIHARYDHNHIIVDSESPARFNFNILNVKQDCELVSRNLIPSQEQLNIINSVHTESYLDILKKYAQMSNNLGMRLPLDKYGDCMISPNSYEAAIEGACMTMELIADSFINVKPAIVIARPPGHHAGRNFGEGFCLINNIACGAMLLIQQHKLNKIFILDVDAHKGNGTYDIVCHHPLFQQHVYFEDIYLQESYRGSDIKDILPIQPPHVHSIELTKHISATAQDNIINQIKTRLKDTAFDFVLVSFGLDGHKHDPLGGDLGYNDDFYVSLVQVINNEMRGKCVFILEGGYNQKTNMRIINKCIDILESDNNRHEEEFCR